MKCIMCLILFSLSCFAENKFCAGEGIIYIFNTTKTLDSLIILEKGDCIIVNDNKNDLYITASFAKVKERRAELIAIEEDKIAKLMIIKEEASKRVQYFVWFLLLSCMVIAAMVGIYQGKKEREEFDRKYNQ